MSRYLYTYYDVDYEKRYFSKHYDVDYTEKILGKGAFGTVRRCVQRLTGLKFAVKIIQNVSEEEWKDVLKEAEILRKLEHPHIVVLHDSFQEEHRLYLVFDLVNGGELYKEIVTRKHYSEADASNSMHQILEAIRYCHKEGVVHRDLKPENILLESKVRGARIKIADFGIAFKVDGDQRGFFGLGGTLTHMAPEVWNNEQYGNKIDIWSCGVILYTLLVGYPPFYAKTEIELEYKITTGVYEYHKRVKNTISSTAKSLVKEMLNVNSYDRFSAVQALNHPWIINRRLVPKSHLPETVVNLKRFNARRKFKAGILAAMAAKRFWKKPELTKAADSLRVAAKRLRKKPKLTKAGDSLRVAARRLRKKPELTKAADSVGLAATRLWGKPELTKAADSVGLAAERLRKKPELTKAADSLGLAAARLWEKPELTKAADSLRVAAKRLRKKPKLTKAGDSLRVAARRLRKKPELTKAADSVGLAATRLWEKPELTKAADSVGLAATRLWEKPELTKAADSVGLAAERLRKKPKLTKEGRLRLAAKPELTKAADSLRLAAERLWKKPELTKGDRLRPKLRLPGKRLPVKRLSRKRRSEGIMPFTSTRRKMEK